MKRTASILLLTILAFNWIGYRFISGYFEHRADIAFENSIDKSAYDESTLIELRIPLNMPYVSGSTEFERYSGEIELNGTHYKYVKRKIEKEELVLLCLPNNNKTKFENSRVDFFKLVNDLDNNSNTKEKKSSSFKSLTTEYAELNNLWSVKPLFAINIQHITEYNNHEDAGYISIPKQPPRI